MATFSTLQTRVQSNIIDLPTAVLNQVNTFINAAILALQEIHDFQVMEAEKQYITPVQTPTQTHILGQIPANWKSVRGNPYYVLSAGSTRGLLWQPDREYLYREYEPTDPNQTGAPRRLLLGEATNDTLSDPDNPDLSLAALNIEIYPYPDGSSDWTDGNYRVHIPYWTYLPQLSAGTDTNWFCADGPRAEFVVAYATRMGFEMDWDEQRAAYWQRQAWGGWDGVNFRTLGGYARQVLKLDAARQAQPSKTLAPRRDVFGPRDQWRQ